MDTSLLQPFRHLATTSRRVRINLKDSATGARIGGNPPKGVVPAVALRTTHYFATLPLGRDGSMELSLFSSICYDDGSPHNLYDNVSRLHEPDTPMIQCIVHPRTPRSEASTFVSELISRSLTIEPEAPDILVEPGGELLLGSKIGGRPYVYYYDLNYIDALNRLFDQGFCLLLQYAEGGYERGKNNMSPFDEYTFHLLAKENEEGLVLRYGWG